MTISKIASIHRSVTNNLGDLNATPVRWFPQLYETPILDIRGYLALDGNTSDNVKLWLSELYRADGLIIGGGGLFGLDFFEPSIDTVLKSKRTNTKAVVWGAGHNNYKLGSWSDMKIAPDPRLEHFDLVGIRDYDIGYEWVPCTSCLSPLFDANYDITTEIGVFSQDDLYHSPLSRVEFETEIPVLNNLGSLETTIGFLASCETVLTDSYHGAYWATLLGRKVIAFPTSEKFYGLKHPVALCQPEDWRRFLRLATQHSDALDECRQANEQFAQRVFDFLGV